MTSIVDPNLCEVFDKRDRGMLIENNGERNYFDDTHFFTDTKSLLMFDKEPLILEPLFPSHETKFFSLPLKPDEVTSQNICSNELYGDGVSNDYESFPEQIFSSCDVMFLEESNSNMILPGCEKKTNFEQEAALFTATSKRLEEDGSNVKDVRSPAQTKKNEKFSKRKKRIMQLPKETFFGENEMHKSISSDRVRKYDVLFGRGKRSNNHWGNKYFRRLVVSMSDEYRRCSKPQKTALSNSIVKKIISKGGKFLSPLPNSEAWVEVRGLALRKKTSQALRDSSVYRS